MWTSALATAGFLAASDPRAGYVLVKWASRLHCTSRYTLTENNPDYVVVGETRNYSFDSITKAVRLVSTGSRSSRPTRIRWSEHRRSVARDGAVTALISRAPARRRISLASQPAHDPFGDARLNAHSEPRPWWATDGHRRRRGTRSGPAHHPRPVGRIRRRRRTRYPTALAHRESVAELADEIEKGLPVE